MKTRKVAKGILTVGAILAIVAYGRLDYIDEDDKFESINIKNSVPIEINHDPSKTPKDYFEQFYHVSETSDNYKVWEAKFNELNENSIDGSTIKIPVLKQIYEGKEGYEARHDSLDKLINEK